MIRGIQGNIPLIYTNVSRTYFDQVPECLVLLPSGYAPGDPWFL